jgi:hypothetical protein
VATSAIEPPWNLRIGCADSLELARKEDVGVILRLLGGWTSVWPATPRGPDQVNVPSWRPRVKVDLFILKKGCSDSDSCGAAGTAQVSWPRRTAGRGSSAGSTAKSVHPQRVHRIVDLAKFAHSYARLVRDEADRSAPKNVTSRIAAFWTLSSSETALRIRGRVPFLKERVNGISGLYMMHSPGFTPHKMPPIFGRWKHVSKFQDQHQGQYTRPSHSAQDPQELFKGKTFGARSLDSESGSARVA